MAAAAARLVAEEAAKEEIVAEATDVEDGYQEEWVEFRFEESEENKESEEIWSEWSQCEEGWRYRELHGGPREGMFEEEECRAEAGIGTKATEWSSWGECDPNTMKAARMRETEDWGMEEEEKDCESDKLSQEGNIELDEVAAWHMRIPEMCNAGCRVGRVERV